MALSIKNTRDIKELGIERIKGMRIIREKVTEQTSERLNKLLKNQILQYIVYDKYPNEYINENEFAFEMKGYEIIINGKKEIIPITNSEKIEHKQNAIIIGNEIYEYDEGSDIKIINLIGITKKEDIVEEKINTGYYKIEEKGRRQYINKDNVRIISKPGKIKEISIMEITSLDSLNEKEQMEFLKSYFNNFITENNEFNKEFLEEINELFSNAKRTFIQRTGVLQKTKYFRELENKEFKSIKDVEKFLKEASNIDKNRRKTTIYCTLLKFMYLFNEMKKKPIFSLLDKYDLGELKTKEMIYDIFELPRDTKIELIPGSDIYKFEKKISGVKTVITFRIKSITSIMKKAVSKGRYIDLDNFLDIFGASVYVVEEDRGKLIDILKYIDKRFYNSQGYLENKGTIEERDVAKLDSNDVYNEKYIKVAGKSKKNKGTGDNYKDCKFTGKGIIDKKEGRESIPEGGMYVGLEIKIMVGSGGPEEDKNEIGMSFHPIYEYFGKFMEGEKNRQPFISGEMLQDHIYNLYNILDNEYFNKKYGKSKYQILKEIYEQLVDKYSNGNNNREMPTSVSNRKLQEFYRGTITPLIFKYLNDKYKFVFDVFNSKAVLITKDNMKQLEEGGRGYTFSMNLEKRKGKTN